METLPLREAFVRRDKRFALLEKGIEKAGWLEDKSLRLLEVGCAQGDASLHLEGLGFKELTAVDLDGEAVREAAGRGGSCRFIQADACRLPFEENSFDGVFSEAAFALIPRKDKAAEEYRRILRPGGRVLINDFMLRTKTESPRKSVQGIPCLEGVQDMDTYLELFSQTGFDCVYKAEEFPELVRIALSLSRTYGIAPDRVGSYLVSAFGRDEFVNDFFSQTQMSYCQLVFEKRKEHE